LKNAARQRSDPSQRLAKSPPQSLVFIDSPALFFNSSYFAENKTLKKWASLALEAPLTSQIPYVITDILGWQRCLSAHLRAVAVIPTIPEKLVARRD
jgi:hypothetical protein